MLGLVLVACTDVRPIVKIGLIAPFEGLYRRTGYEALAAMRQALADAPAGPVAIIPLALDNSADPARTVRAAEKLLVDPQVQAVVGPLSPALAAASRDRLGAASLPWFAPYAVAPAGGFAAPFDDAWAAGLIRAAGAAVQTQGATTLVLAGNAQGWPAWDDAAWTAVAGLPVRTFSDAPAAAASLTSRDAIFWRGAAAEAAAFLELLPPQLANIPFWLGPAGGDPILTERTKTDSKLYWLTWSNVYYNDWAAHHSPATPSAFLVYQATRAAIDAVTGAASTAVTPWHVELFEVENGVSRSYTP
jgi:branched-chain amino acid transport system substrate-binding protein